MFCSICNSPLDILRLEGLNFLGIDEKEYSCLKCAELITKKKLGIYTGFVGASGMFLTDSISQVSGIEREPDNYDLENNEENE